MASEVGIVNNALLKLGENPISSFEENSKAARLAQETYADYRDALLRDHPWNFALRRVGLSASTTTPTWGYDNAFPLPTEPSYCLRVVEVQNPNDKAWRIEGRTIVTDMGAPLNILYVQRVGDPNEMDSDFRDALSSFLAMNWAERLTKSADVYSMMTQQFNLKIKPARSVDGQEGTPPVVNYSWIESRF